ncbi:LRRN4 protein, partial [Polyodon spathula]|nr:LRRN4 C-terminal-like protein [Polyodon spathula]MBN3277076.1 LRRN4 protein [Polyodon spathula]
MPSQGFLRACPLFLPLALLLSLRTDSIAGAAEETKPETGSSSASGSTAPPTTLLRRVLIQYGWDYGDEGDPGEGGDPPPDGGASLETRPPGPPPLPCDYQLCRDGQVPCSELSREKQCLCPGVSLSSVAPEPPNLLEVSQQDRAAVRVHWCAPASTVDRYQITYHGRETEPGGGGSGEPRTVEFGNRVRIAVLDGLEPGLTYRICVRAVNKANSGSADPGGSSACSDYALQPPHRVYLYAGLAGGAVVLLVAALSVLASRRCRANGRAGRDAMGLANPSYSRGSVDMLTS